MVSALSVLLLMFLSINGIPVSFQSIVYMCPFYQWYTCALSINCIHVSFLSMVYLCPFLSIVYKRHFYQWYTCVPFYQLYTCVFSVNGIPVYGIFKVLLLVSKSQLGLAPSYLTDFMRKPMSSLSASPLRSTDRLDLFVPRVRTALAQCCAFAVTCPSSWNGLPPVLRAKLMSGISTTSCRSLKTFLFLPELPR